MRRKEAKKSMKPADESVRRVVRLTKKRDKFVQLKNVELVKLGHRIRRARKLLGFSQRDFSTKCGLDRSYLGGVERGNRNVTFGVLCTICDGAPSFESMDAGQTSLRASRSRASRAITP